MTIDSSAIIPAVEVRGVSKSFRPQGAWRAAPRTALDRVDLMVREGEMVAVVGLNGSGKSTLIRVIATLTTPDCGSVRVFGHDAVRESSKVRHLINRVSVDASFFK
jgi:ABC-2 type transport system ATP-binding protein